jgi:PTS system ascorbate-specific IIA component
MSVGLLIITHNQIGEMLLQTATSMLGFCPLLAHTLPVTPKCNPDQLRDQARVLAQELDQGDGVLVLTDMFGSTPSNIATSLGQEGKIAVVSGINLPMLVRVMNYPHLSLERITTKAVSGGHDGILDCQEWTNPLMASG